MSSDKDELTGKIAEMGISFDKCASCSKVGDGLKVCNGCKLVKYCSRDCQMQHRPVHKEACQKRAAEILDEQLFKQPLPPEDCPVCMLRLPQRKLTTYQLCCGKRLCNGCMNEISSSGKDICPFCNQFCNFSNKESVRRCQMRMDAGDADAFNMMGGDYDVGDMGLPVDHVKAVELYKRAAELGDEMGKYNLGCAYFEGVGVARSKKKAIHYWNLAAIQGHARSRYNLAAEEMQKGNHERALKHFAIGAKMGDKEMLTAVATEGYKKGRMNEFEFMEVVRAYETYNEEINSEQRNKAVDGIALDRAMSSLFGREKWQAMSFSSPSGTKSKAKKSSKSKK